ncbi:MAG: DUF1501 domain-containing protein, partial [Planctomycetes bacterium]|nr:DUF1501 domain-containing protein [Planctomycetota bacterium]
MNASHAASAVHSLLPAGRDLIRVGNRRWFLQTGLAGFAGLTLADTLRARTPDSPTSKKAVILFWLSGGPSQIDTWDPKPDAPAEIRGPYKTIQTSVPGVRFCEHLPLQAKLAHKLTVLRSIDCSASDHTPVTMQAGNPLSRRTNDGKDGGGYPSMGSVAAKFRGANAPAMPAFVGLADSWKADVYGAGHMGHAFEPVKGHELPGRLALPAGVALEHLQDRDALRRQFDNLKRDVDTNHQMAATDDFAERALDMVISPKVRTAFDVSKEPEKLRDAYGSISVGE